MRDERDEVCAQRREAAQLLDGRALRVVGPDVLDRGRDEASEQGEQLDLLLRERARLLADDRDHPDRARAREQRRDHAAVQAEPHELGLLVEARLAHVLAVDRLASEHLFQERPRDRPVAAGREDVRGRDARGRHHVRHAAFGEDDRGPVERHEPAQLPDEGAERLVEVERGAERPRAAPGRLEQVDTPAESVAQLLGLGRLRFRGRRLAAKPCDEPADDQPGQQQDPEREAHVVPAELGRAEAVRPPPLEEDERREEEDRHDDTAAQAEAQRRLDDREDERPARRAAVLVREEERIAADHGGVEAKGDRAEERRHVATGPARDEEQDRPEREHRRQRPGDALVARREALGEDADLHRREEDSAEPYPGDPALDVEESRVGHDRASIRSSAQSACSRSSSSSDSAYGATAARSRSPPTFPAATSAFRRRKRGSLRGTYRRS